MPRAVAQLAMDEQVISDAVIEEALEDRQRAKDELGAVRKEYNEINTIAAGKIEELELPVGAVARVGRFRIERKDVPARSVVFDSKASTRVVIGVVDES